MKPADAGPPGRGRAVYTSASTHWAGHAPGCFDREAEASDYSRQLSVATGKSYKACYRKLRTLLNKPIRDTAEDTACKVIQTAEENINSQQALINICILVRKMHPEMPTDEFVKQRTTNQEDVLDTLRQANSFKQLPSLKEYDDFIEY